MENKLILTNIQRNPGEISHCICDKKIKILNKKN